MWIIHKWLNGKRWKFFWRKVKLQKYVSCHKLDFKQTCGYYATQINMVFMLDSEPSRQYHIRPWNQCFQTDAHERVVKLKLGLLLDLFTVNSIEQRKNKMDDGSEFTLMTKYHIWIYISLLTPKARFENLFWIKHSVLQLGQHQTQCGWKVWYYNNEICIFNYTRAYCLRRSIGSTAEDALFLIQELISTQL